MRIICCFAVLAFDNCVSFSTLFDIHAPEEKGKDRMDIKQARLMHSRFVAAMRDKGSKERGVVDTEWLIGHLLDKMEGAGIPEVNPQSLRAAALHYMGTDVTERAKTKTQATVKTAVAMYWSYCANGKIVFKTTLYPTGVPEPFKRPFMEYCDHLAAMSCSYRSAQTAECLLKALFCWLHEEGVDDIRALDAGMAREFARCHFLPKKEGMRAAGKMAKTLDWLNAAGYIGFGSAEAFPYGYGRAIGGAAIPSHYSPEEVKRVFSVVDRSTATGKRDYLVMCLLAIYGMRIGDIIDLKLGDIDWEAGLIAKSQCKTGNPLNLPIVGPVREALVDYLDTRPESDDPHLLLRLVAPYAGYTCTNSFTKMVSGYMRRACIDTKGRRHGCHSLRHSMAGGMIAEGASIEQISEVLGHSSTKSTQAYLSFDAATMRRISLEVPHVAF